MIGRGEAWRLHQAERMGKRWREIRMNVWYRPNGAGEEWYGRHVRSPIECGCHFCDGERKQRHEQRRAQKLKERARVRREVLECGAEEAC